MGRAAPVLNWRLYAWGVIALFLLLQILQWPFFPKFLDMYYHLSVMKGFADAGGVVTWAGWEGAPAGRPHLYPPFLHVGMLALYRVGLGPLAVARLVDVLSFPLLLWAIFHAVSRLYSDRLAFFAVFLAASAYPLYLASVTLAAFNAAFIFTLLALTQLEKKNAVRAGMLFGLCFYTHTGMAFLAACAFGLYLAFRPSLRRTAAAAAALAVGMALPLLVFQFLHRGSFEWVRVRENRALETDFFIAMLAAWGAGIAARKRSKFFLPVALSAGMLPVLAVYPPRFLSGHGLAALSVLAATALDRIAEWSDRCGLAMRTRLAGLAAVLLFFGMFAPVVEWGLGPGAWRWGWGDRTLTRLSLPEGRFKERPRGHSVYFEKDYEEILKIIRARTREGDILWCNVGHIGGLLAALSDRAASSVMLAEMNRRQEDQGDPLRDARLILWFKDGQGKPLPEMEAARSFYGFRLVQETGLAFIFENPGGGSRSRSVKPTVPTVFLLGIGAAFAAAFAASGPRKSVATR